MEAPGSAARTRAHRVLTITAICGAWVAIRVVLLAFLAGALPYPDGPSILNDVRLYAEWSELLATGRFPIGDDMWQYPPGAGAIFAAASFVGPNPLIGFLILALAADAAVLILLLVAGRSCGRWSPAWVWTLSAAVIGPVFLARFDIFPTVAAVVAVIWVSRPVLSGASAAIGALLKVWPAFMIVALPRRSLLRGGTAFAITVGLGLAIGAVWASGGISFTGEQRDRGLQVESVGAMPYLLLGALGEPVVTRFRFGSMELDMPGSTTVGLVIAVLGFLALGGLLLLRLLGRLESALPGDVALTALLVSVMTSRVISPQYAVWVAGLAAVALLDPRTRMRPVVWLVAVWAAAGQYIYPLGYGAMLAGAWPSVIIEAVRTAALVAATALAAREILRRPPPETAPESSGDVLAADESQRRDETGVSQHR